MNHRRVSIVLPDGRQEGPAVGSPAPKPFSARGGDRRPAAGPAPRLLIPSLLAAVLVTTVAAAEPRLPLVTGVPAQPLAVHARQLVETLEFTGSPLDPRERKRLEEALAAADEATVAAGVQAVFDPLCLVAVHINPESRVKVSPGPARPLLLERGWSQFLVKVHNEAGVTAKLAASSPQAAPVHAKQYPEPKEKLGPADIRDRWCDLRMFDGRPLRETLSGLGLEYRIIQISSRDAGQRAAGSTQRSSRIGTVAGSAPTRKVVRPIRYSGPRENSSVYSPAGSGTVSPLVR